MRLRFNTTSSKTGTLPPTRPVLPPCGTTASPRLWQWRITADTSAVVFGRSTAPAVPRNRRIQSSEAEQQDETEKEDIISQVSFSLQGHPRLSSVSVTVSLLSVSVTVSVLSVSVSCLWSLSFSFSVLVSLGVSFLDSYSLYFFSLFISDLDP